GAYRIIVGSFADEQAPVPVRADLIARGYAKEMSIVRRPSEEQFAKTQVVVDDEGERYTIDSESLLVMPATETTVRIDNKPYRTAARVFINERGLLNIINELNLEEYLYGVVPAEMGPRVYDELEALKAQATAARTYAVRNLGQFRREGYDICPGPACQAYVGFSGEEPLTNQAVKETAGLVMTYQGKLIDALYTSTCGGETSDVSTMFPGRNDPWLKRAKCVELEMTNIAGRADSGLLNEVEVNAHLFAALAGAAEKPAQWTAREVASAVNAALRFAGAPETTAPAPKSSRRGDVLRYLAAALNLEHHGRALTMPEDREYWFPQTGPQDDVPYLAASFLIKYGIVPMQQIDRIDLNAAMPRDELYALLGSWLREHAVFQEATGKILTIAGRTITLKSEGKTQTFTLAANIPIFRRLGDRFQEYKSVPVMIGDRAFVQLSTAKQPVAMIVQANFDGASFDRTSSFANWTRSYRADELVPVINRRNPITELVDIRPVTIDPSQRISELEVTAEGGRKFMLRGLPVRWSLNVPDNLFTYDKTKDPDGQDRYTFYGKGWGHGTGMCQVGAYGMAFRGRTYDQILRNYYSGIEIVTMANAQR
ncbi:MAG TPA: SpoIID/LytB domain-containing protein, partial [Thermoanaerobaculia bacterium]